MVGRLADTHVQQALAHREQDGNDSPDLLAAAQDRLPEDSHGQRSRNSRQSLQIPHRRPPDGELSGRASVTFRAHLIGAIIGRKRPGRARGKRAHRGPQGVFPSGASPVTAVG